MTHTDVAGGVAPEVKEAPHSRPSQTSPCESIPSLGTWVPHDEIVTVRIELPQVFLSCSSKCLNRRRVAGPRAWVAIWSEASVAWDPKVRLASERGQSRGCGAPHLRVCTNLEPVSEPHDSTRPQMPALGGPCPHPGSQCHPGGLGPPPLPRRTDNAGSQATPRGEAGVPARPEGHVTLSATASVLKHSH